MQLDREKKSDTGGTQEGVMDSALASLRGGEAFEMKRKERRGSMSSPWNLIAFRTHGGREGPLFCDGHSF